MARDGTRATTATNRGDLGAGLELHPNLAS